MARSPSISALRSLRSASHVRNCVYQNLTGASGFQNWFRCRKMLEHSMSKSVSRSLFLAAESFTTILRRWTCQIKR